MGHAWRLPPSGTTGDAVEGLATSVTDQNPGERVYPLLPSRWAEPPWLRLFYSHVLASLLQLFHFFGHMMKAVPDHFIGLALMLDGLPVVEPVVQNRTVELSANGLPLDVRCPLPPIRPLTQSRHPYPRFNWPFSPRHNLTSATDIPHQKNVLCV